MALEPIFKLKFSDSLEFYIKHGDTKIVSLRSSFALPSPTLVHISRDCSIMPVDTPAIWLNSIHIPERKTPTSPDIQCGPRQINTNGIVRSKSRTGDYAGSRSGLETICARYSGVTRV